MNTCNLCENPYPYNCEQCISQIANASESRMYVGSGEDVILDLLNMEKAEDEFQCY